MSSIVRRAASLALALLAAGGISSRTDVRAAQPHIEARPSVGAQGPMAWPEKPILPCRARVEYATQFLEMMNQGLPEQRIHFAGELEPTQELAEILEIRRRVYHDREALNEILACATGNDI